MGPDPRRRSQSMEPSGPLDQTWGPGSEAADEGDQRYYTSGLTATTSIALNASRPLFADERVRRAVASAIDREDLTSPVGRAHADRGPGPRHAGRWPRRRRRDPSRERGRRTGAHGRCGGRRPRSWASTPRVPSVPPRTSTSARRSLRSGSACSHDRSTDRDTEFDMFAIWWGTTVRSPRRRDVPVASGGRRHPAGLAPSGCVRRGAGPPGPADRRGARTPRARSRSASRTRWCPPSRTARERTSAFFSPRLGCRSFPPFGFGVDLAALCLADATG